MTSISKEADGPWWKRGVIYQIYPRSFADTDGDGAGDLAGILEHLDYLVDLGIDAVWLSPIYPSPMADFGYDVSNYVDIDPVFGTLEDFDRLVAEAHGRGLRVILDFVPNHTSNQHPWFEAARSSRDDPHRDWYLWRDAGPGGGPPNNWLSNFGGSAWEWDAGTQQYYYHAFLPEQPDLNWRNAEVQQAMSDVLRFWLDRGVDGFRVDVIWHLVKDAEFRDNPPNEDYTPDLPPYNRFRPLYSTDQPEVFDVIARLRSVTDEYEERVLLGEIYLPVERLVKYYGEEGEGVHLPYNFQLVLLPWDAEVIDGAIRKYEAALPEVGWPTWVLSNHDRPRIASRIGGWQARVAAMLLLTLRGTPTLYYGDEIGMESAPLAEDRVRDPFEQRVPGLQLGRDPSRTPMQWNASEYAGFSTVEPWLPLPPDAASRNVQQQLADPRSMLALHRRLLALREEPALAVGSFEALPRSAAVLAFVRRHGNAAFLAMLNLSETQATYDLPEALSGGELVVSTQLDRAGERIERTASLRANEGVLVRLAPPDLGSLLRDG